MPTQLITRKGVLDSENGKAHSARVIPDKKQFSLNRAASKSNFLSVINYETSPSRSHGNVFSLWQ
jgi:hypothetical protein